MGICMIQDPPPPPPPPFERKEVFCIKNFNEEICSRPTSS